MTPPREMPADHPLRTACLSGRTVLRVRRLEGFAKGTHREPTTHSAATEAYVRKAGAADLATRADRLYQEIRDTYELRRRDLSFRSEGGVAEIRTAGFEVSLSLGQDPAVARQAIFLVEVRETASLDVLTDTRFLAVFGTQCDTLRMDLGGTIDLEERIDLAEAHDGLRPLLTYPADASWLEIRVPEPAMVMRLEATEVTFAIPPGGDLRALLAGSVRLLETFATAGTALVPLPGR